MPSDDTAIIRYTGKGWITFIICCRSRASRENELFSNGELHDGTDQEFIEIKELMNVLKCHVHNCKHLGVTRAGITVVNVARARSCDCSVEILKKRNGDMTVERVDLSISPDLRKVLGVAASPPALEPIFKGFYFIFMIDSQKWLEVVEEAAVARGAVIGKLHLDSMLYVPNGLIPYMIVGDFTNTFSCSLSIALGFRCLDIDWFQESIMTETFLHISPFIRPVGMSFVTGKFHKQEKFVTSVLEGMEVFVHGRTVGDGPHERRLAHKQFMVEICKALGASIVSLKNAAKVDTKVDVCVVVGCGADPKMIRRMKSRAVPVVSVWWIVEAFVTSSIPSFDGHPAFDSS